MAKSRTYLGMDGGATKMMVQSIRIFDQYDFACYDSYNYEICYEEIPGWDKDFQPEDTQLQRKLAQENNLNISDIEKRQGNIIIETVQFCYKQALENHQVTSGVGLCFPGLKTDKKDGTVLLVNGPRIPDFVLQLRKKKIPIDHIYNDSDCCVIGEIRGQSGALRNIQHGIYIGGGTGIADGLVIDGNIADFNKQDNLKRSWELTLPSGVSIESCLAPKCLIDEYNTTNLNNPIISLEALINLAENKHPTADKLITRAVEAMRILIKNRVKYIYNKTGQFCQKIVIGQRLAVALSSGGGKNIFMNKIHSVLSQDVPIFLSTDRRTAALGAAWKAACS